MHVEHDTKFRSVLRINFYVTFIFYTPAKNISKTTVFGCFNYYHSLIIEEIGVGGEL